jgi:hypothetical protein
VLGTREQENDCRRRQGDGHERDRNAVTGEHEDPIGAQESRL